MEWIYLDSNASTPLLDEVKNEMQTALDLFANPSAYHPLGQKYRQLIEKSRQQMAEIFNAAQVVFCSSGSMANNLALRGLAAKYRGQKRHILLSAVEHSSILNTGQALQKQGFQVQLIPVDSSGRVLVDEFKKMITNETFLVSVMSANNELGTLQPLSELADICTQKEILFHCDAIQSTAFRSFDLKKEKIDLMSIAAHKFYGPKGMAALVFKEALALPGLISGGSQELSMIAGTENLPGILGMEMALQWLESHRQDLVAHCSKLQKDFETELLKIPGVQINAQHHERNPNTTHISILNFQSIDLIERLGEKGICVSAGSACKKKGLQLSHVLEAIQMDRNLAEGSLRISYGWHTTQAELQYTADCLKDLISKN